MNRRRLLTACFAVLTIAVGAVAVDVATVTLKGGDWHVIEWDFQGAAVTGSDTALTDKEVYGQIVAAYWLNDDDNPVSYSTAAITVKPYFDSTHYGSTDLTAGTIANGDGAAYTKYTFWPSTNTASLAPVSSKLFLELSNGFNTAGNPGTGTLVVTVAPNLDQGDNP